MGVWGEEWRGGGGLPWGNGGTGRTLLHTQSTLLHLPHLTPPWPARMQIVGNAKTAGYEQLVRRMLALPSRPAVVMLQTMVPGAAADPEAKKELWKPFHVTQEDVNGAIAQYYDVQWLSFRDATYR